ncbi:MAG: leucyl aminopeptidase [Bdellovibrionota bacterium]
MKIEARKSALENLGVDTLVVFTTKRAESGNKKKATQKSAKDVKALPKANVEGVSKALEAKILSSSEEGAISGGVNEAVLFRDTMLSGARHLLVVGLGEAKAMTHETLRQAAATAVNSLKGSKVKSVAFAMDSLPHNTLPADLTVQALTEGALLATYAFTDFKEKKDSSSPERIDIVASSKTKLYDRGVETGIALAESVNFSRWLGDRPGNRMTPTILAEETAKAAKGSKLKVTVWDRAKIKAEKMGSFLSVSNGSSQEPKFIMMEYKGAAASKRPLCLVGKGLTFDCGGISIKPSAGMEEMKYDMCGGAAVIAAMIAIARLKLKVNVIAFVPSTENLAGPAATKPGDIVIARNGKSIEVNNTDAEGRLILADALVYACEQKPAAILDAATLTGAMVVALGNIHTGFFTRNDKLAERIHSAAESSGEWLWRMPLTDYHVKDMKGTYADLSNISSSKGAGSSTAAGFLEQFVDKDIPWAHFDVAGTAWHVGDRLPYCPRKGASGVMVRTFVEIARDHQ